MSVNRRGYRSDSSDERWALIEPVLAAWRVARVGLGISRPVHDLREIVNAILYVARTGIAWEYLPHDFPPAKTVYDYYAKWEADGTTQRIHDLLRERVRVARGRWGSPSAVVLDSQNVKTSCPPATSVSPARDAAKKIKGRNRHIATDSLGLLLAVIVTATSVQDSAGGRRLLDTVSTDHPTVIKAWVDGGYNTAVRAHGARLSVDVEVVPRPVGKGFHVQPRRWVAERTFGWLMQHRRLVRDYETLPQRTRAMIHWAMANTMSRYLTGESTPTWRNETT